MQYKILVIMFVLLGISVMFFIYKYVFYKSAINFMSAHDTILFLQKDNDNYIKSLSAIDLYARKSKDASEYINNVIQCVVSFTPAEQQKIVRCCKKADAFLRNYNYKQILDCSGIADLPWNFALTTKHGNHQYEDGLPHTRENIIFLSRYVINDTIALDKNDNELTSTLIHEKVHIYQRYNPQIMSNLLSKLGYKANSTLLPAKLTELKRANPDLNNTIYVDSNNNLMLFMYKSYTPNGIGDVTSSNDAMEHPYESMAYEIGNEYIRNILKKML